MKNFLFPALLFFTACSSAPKLPCDFPKSSQAIIYPNQRGSWDPGLYIVDMGDGKPPVLWCSNSSFDWVPSDFEAVKKKAIAEGIEQHD